MIRDEKHPVSSALFGAAAIQVVLAWIAWGRHRVDSTPLEWLDFIALGAFLFLGILARRARVPAAVIAVVLYGTFLVQQGSIGVELLASWVVLKVSIVALLLVGLVLAFEPKKEPEQALGTDSETGIDKAIQVVWSAALKAFCIIVFGLGLSVFVDFTLVQPSLRYAKLRPTEDMNTLEDFASRFGRDCQWLILKIEGETYYEARVWPGQYMSGDACYVFDEKGYFVDWTWDSGDDPRWTNTKWNQTGERHPYSFDQIIENIKTDT